MCLTANIPSPQFSHQPNRPQANSVRTQLPCILFTLIFGINSQSQITLAQQERPDGEHEEDTLAAQIIIVGSGRLAASYRWNG
jgi:hypothetical protein